VLTTLATKEELITRRNPDHHVTIEPSARWLRVMHNGVYIADSKRTVLLHETGHVPVYYFPKEDVRMDLMEPTDNVTQCPYKGDAEYWTLKVGDAAAEENALWSYPEPFDICPDISNYVAFYWNKVEHWFEEDEEIFVHARDPYKRVDAMASTRNIKVVVGGQTVAESDRPTLLFETGMPVRYYLPVTDVRMDLLEASEKVTRCPYKGASNYYSVKGFEDGEDLAWYYRYPTNEASKIANLVCFFNERVDAIYVDGEVQDKPVTRWSKK
tara:strand:+ start:56 stop:862 length:807 start_codon:yes stop_codon:yes gene_type:complete